MQASGQNVQGDRAPGADKDLYAGLIRLHVLHHAGEHPVYGVWIIQELARHGYALSPGTLYPLLHGLERRGYLRSRRKRNAGHARRVYTITARGRTALGEAREKVRELFGELVEQAPQRRGRGA